MPITTFRSPPPSFDHIPIETGNDVDRLLIAADAMLIDNRRNAGVISIAIVRIMSGKRYGLRYLETRYRALRSQTFLVAKPKWQAGGGLAVVGLDGMPRPYFLWVCTNGEIEADATLAAIGVDYEQNIACLDQTGFLRVPT